MKLSASVIKLNDLKVIVNNNITVQLSIWDTAGQERFHALGPIYYRDASGALLVYDITDSESFNKVKNWVKELKKIVGNDIIIVIAGNKIDLEKNRAVNEEEAISYAESVGATHFHTSAKANKGLDEVFFSLAQSKILVLLVYWLIVTSCTEMLEKKGDKEKSGSTKQKLVIVDAPETKKSGGCCWCCLCIYCIDCWESHLGPFMWICLVQCEFVISMVPKFDYFLHINMHMCNLN